MVMPVDEESFNLITKSSKNIIEFVNGLKEDDKLISAVKSIPKTWIHIWMEEKLRPY